MHIFSYASVVESILFEAESGLQVTTYTYARR